MIESPFLQELLSEHTRENLIDLVVARFGVKAEALETEIQAIDDGVRLKELVKLAGKCRSLAPSASTLFRESEDGRSARVSRPRRPRDRRSPDPDGLEVGDLRSARWQGRETLPQRSPWSRISGMSFEDFFLSAVPCVPSASTLRHESESVRRAERLMPPPIDFLDLIRAGPFRRRGRLGGIGPPLRAVHPDESSAFGWGSAGDYDRLRHDVGSSDVCQSVFRSLFRGLKANRFQLDQQGDLEKLLHVMIRFNVATKARRSAVRLRELIDDFDQAGWIDPAYARIRKSPSKT